MLLPDPEIQRAQEAEFAYRHDDPFEPVETPWERARTSRSKQQEDRTAKRSGATSQINSGRTWRSLRDSKLRSFIGTFLIDNKTHENPEQRSYRIVYGDWLALRRDAHRTPPGCLPALQVDLQDVHLFIIELEAWDEVEKYIFSLEAKILELTGA